MAHICSLLVLAAACSSDRDPASGNLTAPSAPAADSGVPPAGASGTVPSDTGLQGAPDASALVASAAVGGSSSCTNQPAGYTKVMDDGFGTSPNGVVWNLKRWSTALVGTQKNLQIVNDNTGPKSPGKILRVVYPAGAGGGVSPARMGLATFPANTGKLYMCVFIRLSSNWTNNGNTGTKFVFLRSAVEGGQYALNHYFNLSPDVAFNLQANGPPSLTRNYTSGSASLGGGGWKKLEALVDGGTTAAARNGSVKLWVDGKQVVNATGVKMFFDGQKVEWRLFWLDPTYGGGTHSVPKTQWFDIDHWYASVK